MSDKRMGVTHSSRLWFGLAIWTVVLVSASVLYAQNTSAEQQVKKDGTVVRLEDFADLPLSTPTHGGATSTAINFSGQLGRVNCMRSEPANAPRAASRFVVVDQSGTLYILDKSTKKFTTYIRFPEVFPKFVSDTGNTAGLICITFDPGYAKNGRFYTVHVEKPDMEGSATPSNVRLKALKLDGYATTPAVNPPSVKAQLESVLIEWTDSDIRNSTFEGSAREVLRVGYDRNHPIGDFLFNPSAQPGQDDYGNLYITVGDGAGGETPGVTHAFPQQLNVLMGKILRITPDIQLRPRDMLGANGRYRIPSSGSNPNPFVAVAGARPEIYAYGFRNPHRLSWDAASNTLLENEIGLHEWEEINIITRGGNYGYAEREGFVQLFVGGLDNGKTGSQVNPDVLTVEGLANPVTPLYPAAMYSHSEGDSLANGFVYHGKLLPQLVGKYIFTDMTTARLFYSDLAEMVATRGTRGKTAAIHEIDIMYKGAKRRLYDIVADSFARKGGIGRPESAPAGSKNGVLPGVAGIPGGWRGNVFETGKPDADGVAYGGGRPDIRIAVGGDGELYILSKSDGMIRKVAAVVSAPSATKVSAVGGK
jgi:glucose/sorbosone dehydrogenase